MFQNTVRVDNKIYFKIKGNPKTVADLEGVKEVTGVTSHPRSPKSIEKNFVLRFFKISINIKY